MLSYADLKSTKMEKKFFSKLLTSTQDCPCIHVLKIINSHQSHFISSQGEKMGPDSRHNNESIQMDSNYKSAGPKQKDPQAT